MTESDTRIRHHRSVVLAAVVLLVGLVSTWWFYRSLEGVEEETVTRHLKQLASFVQADVLHSVGYHLEIQKRVAARLARPGATDAGDWRLDVKLLRSDYPFYQAFAILDSDLSISAFEGESVVNGQGGQIHPEIEEYRGALEAMADTGGFVVVRPVPVEGQDFAMIFVHPIGVGAEHDGYMAVIMSIAEAVQAMVSEQFLDGLALRIFSSRRQIYPAHSSLGPMAEVDWLEAFHLDLDGDGTGFHFEFGLTEADRLELESKLPEAAFAGGVTVSLMLAIIVFLGLNATAQARSLQSSNRLLEQEIRERELAEDELEFLVTHDPLTGLPNRTGSTRYLEGFLADGAKRRDQLALLFLDLDQFKDINDSLGHQLGDQLLCEIPRRLAGVLRESDFVGRHGGDEFLIAVQRQSREQIEQLVVNILRSMDTGFAIDDNRFFISASIGIAYFPESGRSVSELIQNADTALFKAKNAGRNQYAVFTREMFSQAQHRLHLSRDMRHALEAGQFRLAYQPIVSVKDASLCGLEALLRWEHEKGYMVPPQEFIRIAEETGVIGRLGDFALEQALSDLADWQKLTDTPPWLAVNISGAQVREGGFAERLSVLLHQYRIEPALLHLEITEEILIENLVRNRRKLQELDDIGMRIVVDDFGVGYSSLAYLKNFPISVVKIDRGFVRDLAFDTEDQAITRTICSLANDLGMLTVAEGVETLEQMELLRQFRCSFAQGFLFSHPVAADEITAMLNDPPKWRAVNSS
jgi:diguanylate cyclase (GGDEF)-like protein